MNSMKYLLLIVSVVVVSLLHSCKIDEIDTYSGQDYIYFAHDGQEILEYSFSFNPGKEVDTIPLVVKLVGTIATQDREIGIYVDTDSTNAVQSDFLLPSNFVLRAGQHTDTINLVIYKSEKLLEQKYNINLKIADSPDLLCGPQTNIFLNVLFSDMLSRPGWWDTGVVNNFLGEYSDAKYRLFIEATGVADLTGMSESEKRAYALIFRDFLRRGRDLGKEFVDEDGNPITVPEGLFN